MARRSFVTQRTLEVAASLCLAALAGCMVGPKYQRPAVPAPPAAYKEMAPPNPPNGSWKQAQPVNAEAAQLKG